MSAPVEATIAHFGRLDAAFNNADISGPFASIIDMEETDFDQVIAVNLKGVWLSIKYEREAMIAAGNGGSIGTTAYAASEGALEAGAHNIRINTLLPGAIETEMFRSLDGATVVAPLSAHTPLGRIGRPEDVGNVAVWLATDEANFITGQSLLVDGGIAIPGMR